MTRGQLVTRVAAKSGLTNESGHEEQTLMQDWANEAVVDVLLKTHCRVDVGQMDLTVGENTYRTDTDILAVIDAKVIGSLEQEYNIVSLEEILDRQRIQSAADGATWIAVEGDLMVVHPAPASAATIEMYVVLRPTLMTLDSHDPSNATYGGIPTEYHRALEYYMLWQAAEYDEKRAPTQSTRDYRAMYEDEIKLVLKRKRAKASRRRPPMRIGPPGSRFLRRRNDVYPAG